MTYGLRIYPDGYPPINFENWVAIMPLGSYAAGFHNTGSACPVEQVHTFNYPVTPPVGSVVNVTGQTAFFGGASNHGYRCMGNGRINASRTSAQVGYFPCTARAFPWEAHSGCMWFATADMRSVTNTSNYGAFIGNSAMSSVLNNNIAPLHVSARRTINIAAGTKYIEYNLPEYAGNMSGARTTTAFLGTRNNEVGFHTDIYPRNGSDWSSGAQIRIWFFNPNIGHASRVRSFDQTAPISTILYIVVADRLNVTPSGYGLNIYNNNGQVTYSKSHYPVLPRGIIYNKAYRPTNVYPDMLGVPESLPSGMSSSDTFMIPAGTNDKAGLAYHDYFDHLNSTDWFGSGITWVSGSQVRTAFFYARQQANLGGGATNDGFFSVDYRSGMNRRDPIPCIRGEDYFISLARSSRSARSINDDNGTGVIVNDTKNISKVEMA